MKNEVIINSKDTVLSDYSFYRDEEQGDLNNLIFNFTDEFDYNYINNLLGHTGLFHETKVQTIYSKSEFPVDLYSDLEYLSYEYIKDEYHVYSMIPEGESYIITASSGENGHISNLGKRYVTSGESVTYYFQPDEGYKVKSIIVDGEPLEGDEFSLAVKEGYTFLNVTSNHEICVEFEKIKYLITVERAANGSITPDTSYFEYGSSATFTITPNDGYYTKYLLIDDKIYTTNIEEYTFNNIVLFLKIRYI